MNPTEAELQVVNILLLRRTGEHFERWLALIVAKHRFMRCEKDLTTLVLFS